MKFCFIEAIAHDKLSYEEKKPNLPLLVAPSKVVEKEDGSLTVDVKLYAGRV